MPLDILYTVAVKRANAARLIELAKDDRRGATPLHYAASDNDAESLRALLEGGADVSATDKHGNTPLWTAAFNARQKHALVKLLLAKGADPTHKNKAGRSPLDFANTINDQDMVALLSKQP